MSQNEKMYSRAAELSGPGVSARAIADQLGVCGRTVERWRKAGLIPPSTPRELGHGYASRYNQGCRCDECTEAATARHATARRERFRLTRSEGLPSHVRHGLSAGRNWGCRCQVCVAAIAEANREYQQKVRVAREQER